MALMDSGSQRSNFHLTIKSYTMGFFSDLFREIKKVTTPPESPKQWSIHDDVYGPLEWEASPAWWVGEYVCPVHGPFRLTVAPSDEPGLLPDAKPKAFFATLKPQLASAKKTAVDDFLPTFNKEWNDEAPLSAGEFASLLKPESIYVSQDGSVCISFQEADDTEPLGGHCLGVTFETDGSSSVTLQG